MKYLILFNKIFNGRKTIEKEVQTIATILAHNYYHPNAKLKNYRIQYMTPENNFEREKHSAVFKVQSPNFIILPRYIASKLTTTITLVLFKDSSNKNSQAISSK